jgi:hypothetical protein
MVVPAPGANGAICWCRQMSSGTSICPACAERQLLALLSTTPNTSLSSEERVALSEVVSGWLACLPQAVLPKGGVTISHKAAKPAAGGPPALPPHMTALGEQRQLVAGHGRRWIGCARATPEELCYLKGIVIYDDAASCFLSEDEAREAFITLGWLLIQLSGLQVGDVQVGEEPKQS